ncbi:YlmC/YmxH family sporulation protein [Oceanirhabdus seepicola]|uniref:YlmC/YmxH family sporulation protein n=1 Tax=Oceanirhabdus seepicola TaxID=2828781 RepID=A0A9J6P3Z2_9CLOT|nr:YlmC/YmxH family sporulation protein [Oceanirhabdus seepicola]MCM1990886.1 YlmC/YmxH family sporulation protein [Oceanirhabdus seepicola]
MEEDLSLFSINSLKSMEVIDISTGARMGYIKDFVVDCDGEKVESVIIPYGKVSFFAKDSYVEVPWDKIYKIGVDVILVEGEEYMDKE